MQTKPQTRKPIKFLNAKILIATLSAATTIGLWNLIANDSLQVERAKANNDPAQDPQQTVGETQGLAPLPTLIPLVDVSAITQGNATGQNVAVSQSNTAPTLQLRSVDAPSDQKIVQKNKIAVDSAVVVVSGGGGGGKSSATTKSSR